MKKKKVKLIPTLETNCKNVLFIDKKVEKTMLKLSDCASLFKSLSNHKDQFNIIIGGGEPLLHPEIMDMVKLCKKNGLNCSLETNGLLLKKNIIDQLIKHGLDTLILPLESVNPRTHNFIWNNQDLFEIIWEAIDHLSYKYENSAKLIFKCTIMKQNLREILPTMGWVINFNYAKIKFLPISPDSSKDKEWHTKKPYISAWPKNKEIFEKTMDYLNKTKLNYPGILINELDDFYSFKKYYFDHKNWVMTPGSFEDDTMYVNPDSSVLFQNKTIGNISKESLIKILQKIK